VTGIQKRLDSVDHRQPGADQQYRGLSRHAGRRVRMPWVAEVGALALVRGQITGCQHDPVDPITAASGDRQRDTAGILVQRHRLVGNQKQVASLAALPQLVAQQTTNVGSVEPARDEGLGSRRGPRMMPQPIEEVIRLIVEGTHVACSDVQQVSLICGRVG
jgi:hypothetical protein